MKVNWNTAAGYIPLCYAIGRGTKDDVLLFLSRIIFFLMFFVSSLLWVYWKSTPARLGGENPFWFSSRCQKENHSNTVIKWGVQYAELSNLKKNFFLNCIIVKKPFNGDIHVLYVHRLLILLS